ncbi:MAG: adenosylmethionine decarboxylase [Caldilineaceae bacterium]
MDILIRHIIIELTDCAPQQLDDPTFLEDALVDVTKIMQTDVKSKSTYHFAPQGVTSILIIGASHISVHTWPEHNYANIDLVVCTTNFTVEEIVAFLRQRFGTDQITFTEILRGAPA